MAKFDIYQPSPDGALLLLDLQDDILADLSTRVVAPLVSRDEVPQRMKILNPLISVGSNEYVLMTHLLAAIPATSLKEKFGSALKQRDEILASLDFLFTGF